MSSQAPPDIPTDNPTGNQTDADDPPQPESNLLAHMNKKWASNLPVYTRESSFYFSLLRLYPHKALFCTGSRALQMEGDSLYIR